MYVLSLVSAVLEAEDIDLYLRPLRRLISSLEEKAFPQVESLLAPLFHTLCLVWSRSQHYCCPQRMVLLLQEFCNMLIEKVGSLRTQPSNSSWRRKWKCTVTY